MRTWSSTQASIATSSAEAELYAMSEGSSRGLGFKTVLEELGEKMELVVISTDSSAAKSFVATRGLGKMRHLEVKDLWMQELVRKGRLKVAKVRGDQNPADPLTKFLDRYEIARSLSLCGFRVEFAGQLDKEYVSRAVYFCTDGVPPGQVDSEGGCLLMQAPCRV